MRNRVVIAGILLGLALPIAAQQTYTLKIKDEPSVGKSFTASSRFDADASMKFSDSNGRVLQSKQQVSSRDMYYVETTLAQEQGHGSVFTRDYRTATETTDGVKKPHTFEGRSVTFRKNGEEFNVTADGATLSPEDIETLVDEIRTRFEGKDENEAMLPKKPVKVGESWDVDLSAFTDDANFGEVDKQQSRGTATLTKVYDNGGHQFGTIDGDVVLLVKSMSGMTFPEPAKMTMHYTLDGALDGTGTQMEGKLTATLPARMLVEDSGIRIYVDLTMKFSADERHTAETAAAAAPKSK